MRVALGSDHAGFPLKESVKEFIKAQGHTIKDYGTYSSASVDYPDFGHLLAKKVKNNNNNFGILVCGSGIGMSMTANRHKNIRAALCYNVRSAKLSRKHNNANVMTVGSRLTKKNVALKCVKAFLTTKFEGGRHLRRVKKI
mgnify:CR=1 FL=1